MAAITKAVGKAEYGLNRLGYWVTGYTVVTGLSSWCAKHLTWLGPIGWPEAVFLGLGAASLVLTVLSITMIAWRFFNPHPGMKAEESTGLVPQQQYDDAELRSEISEIASAVRLIESRYQRVDEFEAKFTAETANLSREIDRLGSSYLGIDKKLDQLPTPLLMKFGQACEFRLKVAEFAKEREKIIEAFEKIAAMAADPQHHEGSEPSLRPYHAQIRNFETTIKGADQRLKKAGLIEHDLGSLTEFDKNPYQPVEGEGEVVGGMVKLHAFRRAYAMKQSSLQTIHYQMVQYAAGYTRRIKPIKEALSEFEIPPYLKDIMRWATRI